MPHSAASHPPPFIKPVKRSRATGAVYDHWSIVPTDDDEVDGVLGRALGERFIAYMRDGGAGPWIFSSVLLDMIRKGRAGSLEAAFLEYIASALFGGGRE